MYEGRLEYIGHRRLTRLTTQLRELLTLPCARRHHRHELLQLETGAYSNKTSQNTSLSSLPSPLMYRIRGCLDLAGEIGPCTLFFCFKLGAWVRSGLRSSWSLLFVIDGTDERTIEADFGQWAFI